MYSVGYPTRGYGCGYDMRGFMPCGGYYGRVRYGGGFGYGGRRGVFKGGVHRYGQYGRNGNGGVPAGPCVPGAPRAPRAMVLGYGHPKQRRGYPSQCYRRRYDDWSNTKQRIEGVRSDEKEERNDKVWDGATKEDEIESPSVLSDSSSSSSSSEKPSQVKEEDDGINWADEMDRVFGDGLSLDDGDGLAMEVDFDAADYEG